MGLREGNVGGDGDGKGDMEGEPREDKTRQDCNGGVRDGGSRREAQERRHDSQLEDDLTGGEGEQRDLSLPCASYVWRCTKSRRRTEHATSS